MFGDGLALDSALRVRLRHLERLMLSLCGLNREKGGTIWLSIDQTVVDIGRGDLRHLISAERRLGLALPFWFEIVGRIT